MKVYIILSEEGNLLHVGSTPIGDTPLEVEVPDDCCIFGHPYLYYFDGTNLVKKVETEEQN